MNKEYKTFAEFYPFYLSQHQNRTCRLLHFIGSWLVLFVLAYAFVSHHWFSLVLIPIIGYGFAWIGHFFFEKNRPATFTYPWYSLLGDWMMFKDILSGKLSLKDDN